MWIADCGFGVVRSSSYELCVIIGVRSESLVPLGMGGESV